MHFSFTVKIAVGVYLKMFTYLLFLVSFCAYDLQSLREAGLGYERWTLPTVVRVASFDFRSD
jgi:cytochrome c oxidase subunit IV